MVQVSFEKAGNRLRVGALDESHWQAYRDFYSTLSGPTFWAGYLKEKTGPAEGEPDDPDQRPLHMSRITDDMWSQLMRDAKEMGLNMHGLWKGDKLIGQITQTYREDDIGEKIAIVTGFEVADRYKSKRTVVGDAAAASARENNLGTILYDLFIGNLREQGYNGKIEASIRTDNYPTLHAAQRYGFVITDAPLRDGHLTLRFEGKKPEPDAKLLRVGAPEHGP